MVTVNTRLSHLCVLLVTCDPASLCTCGSCWWSCVEVLSGKICFFVQQNSQKSCLDSGWNQELCPKLHISVLNTSYFVYAKCIHTWKYLKIQCATQPQSINWVWNNGHSTPSTNVILVTLQMWSRGVSLPAYVSIRKHILIRRLIYVVVCVLVYVR